MTELSPKKRVRVERMNLRGLKQKVIATSLNISQGAVSKTLKRIENGDFEGDFVIDLALTEQCRKILEGFLVG